MILAVVLLLAQLFPFPGNPVAVAGCGGNGFTTCSTITISHLKVVGADYSNYVALYYGTDGAGNDAKLATIANGGVLTSASGFDVWFTSDQGCTTLLPYETAHWANTGATVEYYVQIGTASHTVDTVFYRCAGKSAITTDQSNVSGTWPATYQVVSHLSSGSFGQVSMSVPAATSWTCSGCAPAFVSGKIYNGQNDNRTQTWNGPLASLPSGSSITGTIELWAKPSGTDTTYGFMAGWGGTTTATGGSFYLALQATSGNNLAIDVFGGNSWCGAWPLDTTAYHHFVGTSAGATGTALVYVDGVALTATCTAGTAYNVIGTGSGLFGQES